jgi:hypothetical protein
MNWTTIIAVARFLVWLALNIRTLVLEAEENLPESGKGSEKFAAVKDAVLTVASIMGIAKTALDAIAPQVDGKINQAVATTVNAK